MKTNLGGLIKNTAKNLYVSASEHKAPILVGMGIACMTAGFIVAIVKAPKAKDKLDDRRDELIMDGDISEGDRMPIKEVIKTVGPDMAIPVACEFIGATGIILGMKAERRNTARAIAACTVTEALMKDLKEEIISREGLSEGEETIARARNKTLSKESTQEAMAPYFSDGTEQLCYDREAGRRVMLSKNQIDSAFNEIANRLNKNGDPIPVNDLYYEMNLDPVGFAEGLFFTIDWPPHVRYGAKLLENGKTALEFSFDYVDGSAL